MGKSIQKWAKDCTLTIDYTKKIYEGKSEFQEIEIFDSETFGRFWTLDGILMTTEKDEFGYHDMIVHPSFATNPNIKKVLIIGGGDGGTAREVCRYPSVEQIDMVEIDGLVVELAKKYLKQTAVALNSDDKRLNVIIGDGLKFVKESADASYDLIIVDSTDPISVGEGLFTLDFYQNCFRVLNEEGILVNQHESPYFSHQREEMKKAHSKIKTMFPVSKVLQLHQPTYESGHWLLGFASKKYCPLSDHKPSEWEKFNLDTKYYNSDIHKAAFALPTFVKKELENC